MPTKVFILTVMRYHEILLKWQILIDYSSGSVKKELERNKTECTKTSWNNII